jgi:hypothetical protein
MYLLISCFLGGAPRSRGLRSNRTGHASPWCSAWAVLLGAAVSFSSQAAPAVGLTGKAWIDMDYGPFKTHSLEVSKGNMANKAIAIRVDPGPGGVTRGEAFVLFETDTLRMAAGWTGPGFNNWRNIMHNGEHQTFASIVGRTVFENRDAPGWADATGGFGETRFLGRDNRHYGPMSKQVGAWRGLYRHGDKVVLSYRVGETEVLELPGFEGPDSAAAFSRSFEIGPRTSDLILQVAFQDGVQPGLRRLNDQPGASGQVALFPGKSDNTKTEQAPGGPWIALDGATRIDLNGSDRLDLTDSDYTFYARVRTEADGTVFSQTSPAGPWVPFGKTLFVRNGRLGFDIGWVGAVVGDRKINDGQRHRVALSYKADTGSVVLFVDGTPDGTGTLVVPKTGPETSERRDRMRGFVTRLGFTAPDFPTPDHESHLIGSLGDVRFYKVRLDENELKDLGRRRSEYDDKRLAARLDFRALQGGTVADATGNGFDGRIVRAESELSANHRTIAAVIGGGDGAEWLPGADGHLRLRIPSGAGVLRLKVLIGQVQHDIDGFERLVAGSEPGKDLGSYTRGGPRLWTETVTTRAEVLGSADGPFVVESLTVPFENPYRSMMRLGGFDFFSDGTRAAVCTSMGDVWMVGGLGKDPGAVTWTRIAAGMYEPLGLKVVKDQIHVTCRDQITRLHDLNGDGETDFYEAFNHDQQASEHYHEFAMALETDRAGNFYYLKAAGHAMEARFPQHGTLIKVSPDGTRSEIIANGFRAPNGLWASPEGDFFLSTDQEGHWTPMNKINRIVPGGFYGYMLGWHEPRDQDDFTPPLTWMHKKYENSPSRAFYIESDRWGILNGRMASVSYGKGKVFLVLDEKTAGGLTQGGITELDVKSMPTGLERTRFNPNDGQMYACGLFVWCSDQTQLGGFYRVRFTGKSLYMPADLRVANDGVVVRFTEPLEAGSAVETGNYSAEMWKYLRRQNYGSADYKVLSSGVGHDVLTIESATLSSDRKSVFLKIPAIRPVEQMHLDMNLRAADGTRIRTYVHNTIHELGQQSGVNLLENR